MGIDFTVFECMFQSLKYIENKCDVLTLGRQQFHISKDIINCFLDKNNLSQLINNYNSFKSIFIKYNNTYL